jgi:RNA-directed DNA polymerase
MFEAYFECRKNKRNTLNALQFEKNLEKNVFELINEVFTGNYNPGPCDTSLAIKET